MNKAVFLDRDGIINVDKSYVGQIKDFEFSSGIFEVLKYLQSLGYKIIIVTNQSGIGRGYYTKKDFENLTDWMIEEFAKKDIHICEVYYCPHVPEENCECRKPNAQMLESAIKKYDLDTDNSWMIGDKPSDIEAGLKANIPNTIFINTTVNQTAKYNAKTILDIINIIKK
ncbi:MAG: D-glycero-beta-D-manno-heptose 1,7-bisphosphate 7-phosphatase [Sulfurospirillaceae bacterium]|nr:D-glycero-beta-D-manno-heptose 1,7-bisphosphate 7-phosphatase [Sulfurospirillaceae bacterium]